MQRKQIVYDKLISVFRFFFFSLREENLDVWKLNEQCRKKYMLYHKDLPTVEVSVNEYLHFLDFCKNWNNVQKQYFNSVNFIRMNYKIYIYVLMLH